MVCWNARSLNNKTHCVNDFLSSYPCDILCLTETWLYDQDKDSKQDKNQATLAAAVPDGYLVEHKARDNGQIGGGVGCVYSKEISLKRLSLSKKYNQFEILCISLHFKRSKVYVAIVYRPQPSKKNGLKLKFFWPQWCDFLSQFSTRAQEFIIVGDLNFHLDDKNNRSTIKFNRILSEFGLIQHVLDPTHVGGHTLDVVISKLNSPVIKNVEVKELGFINDNGSPIKDHLAVTFILKGEKHEPKQQTFKYRKWKAIDCTHFEKAFLSRLPHFPKGNDCHQMALWYHNNLSELADIHAPLLTKKVTHQSNPWYNSDIIEMKRTARRSERKWKKSGLVVDHQILLENLRQMYKHIKIKKVENIKAQIDECGKDSKKIHSLANRLMGSKTKIMYPSSSSDQDLAESFVQFFANKVNAIQEELESLPESNNLALTSYNNNISVPLSIFKLVSEEEIIKIVTSLPNKQCRLDPMPTWFLKKNLDIFKTVILETVNSSLSNGKMPDALKTALVRPILKDKALDTEIKKNFRPVSNLPVLGKIIEKVVYDRLDQHLQCNNLLDPNQSAYRKCHSTETTLLKLQNDVLCHLDQDRSVALVFIDISAAFDTANHQKLIKCFHQYLGITGTVLQWLESYLTGRKQRVIINESVSSAVLLECGFPQGANLAGLLYNMCTAPLSKIVEKHPAEHKGFADDNGFYIAFVSKNEIEAMISLRNCLTDAMDWFVANNFKVNDDKTHLMYFTPRKEFNPSFHFTLGPEVIEPSFSVESLGIIFDSTMSMEGRINAVTQSVYFHIRNIAKIRQYLSLDTAKILAQTLIISRLDYCNSLLGNLPLRLVNKLKRAQNAAARMLYRKGKYSRSRMTPVLKKLHWLPAALRIKFKILLFAFKCIKGLAPSYLNQLLSEYVPSHNLRSNQLRQRTLVVPRFRKRKYGGRAFSRIAPVLFNELPINVRKSNTVCQFKVNLKTHFFETYFCT